MSDPNDISARVEAYLDYQMSEAEERAFEQELTTNPQLAEALESARAVRKALLIEEQPHMKKWLGSLSERRKRNHRRYGGMILAILLFLIAGYFLTKGLFFTPNDSPIPPDVAPAISTSTHFDSLLRQYDPCESSLGQENPNNPWKKYCLDGILDSAIYFLFNSETTLGTGQQFSLAIMYVKLEQYDQAVEVLEALSSDKEYVNAGVDSYLLLLAMAYSKTTISISEFDEWVENEVAADVTLSPQIRIDIQRLRGALLPQ